MYWVGKKVHLFFNSKISMFYKINMISWSKVSAFRICFTNYGTMIFNGIMSNQNQNPCLI